MEPMKRSLINSKELPEKSKEPVLRAHRRPTGFSIGKTRDFYLLADRKQRSTSQNPNPGKCQIEKHYEELLRQVLKDIRFYLRLLEIQEELQHGREIMERRQKRVFDSMCIIQELVPEIRDLLIWYLRNSEGMDLTAVVYILVSVKACEDPSFFLDKVLKEFGLCSEKRSKYFIHSFKLGMNPEITHRLTEMLSKMPQKNADLNEIIEYRKSHDLITKDIL